MTSRSSCKQTGDESVVSFQWLGDISLQGLLCDPQHHAVLRKNMAEVASLLGPCDLRICNWESPLWGDGGMNLLKRPRLNTTLQAAECMVPLSLDVALLANNHVYDCLDQGYENTIQFLGDKGIRWLGADTNKSQATQPLHLVRNGLRIGLLNYVASHTNPNLPPEARVYPNWLEESRVLDDVRKLAGETDVLLVHFHWGQVEFAEYPTAAQRRLARSVIEAGAHVVVGGHVHCLQGDEPWGKGHIFYSTGHFIFGSNMADDPGRIGRELPSLAKQVGVPSCVVAPDGVKSVRWYFLVQDGLLLKPDETPTRSRKQERLSKPIRKLSDKSLDRLWRRRLAMDWLIMPAVPFLQGLRELIGALCRIRRRHFVSLLILLRQR